MYDRNFGNNKLMSSEVAFIGDVSVILNIRALAAMRILRRIDIAVCGAHNQT